MFIKKKVQGQIVKLDYQKEKVYPRYTEYSVYKMLPNGSRQFLYRTCLTSLQLKKLKENDYKIDFEVVG